MISALLYGSVGPLLVVIISWRVMKRAYLANPAGLMRVLIAEMGAKLVFLGLYAAVMLRVLHLQPVPFVASFAASFIVFHNVEALFMKRLFTA